MVKSKSIMKAIICILLVFGVFWGNYNIVFAEDINSVEIDTRIEQILKTMTLKEKIAQMLYVYVPTKSAKQEQKKYQYGGYLMFANSFEGKTKKAVKNTIKGWQKVSKINMLIGADEEGGTVVRVSKFKEFRKSPFKAPKDVYKNGGYEAIIKDTDEKATMLKSLGINTNFGPVADVAYKKGNYIYKRSFSTNAKKVAKFIQKSVNTYNKNSLVSMMKHFPGYGGNGNTHNKIITDNRSLKTFETRDLLPFIAGIKEGCPMILVNHDIVKCLDKNNTASTSKKVHKYLRKKLGFEGVIITDALDMNGLRKKVKNNGEAAVLAVKAGNDMLCTPYGKTAVNAINKAVKAGTISEKQINTSVKRILKMKLKYGIINVL